MAEELDQNHEELETGERSRRYDGCFKENASYDHPTGLAWQPREIVTKIVIAALVRIREAVDVRFRRNKVLRDTAD